MFMEWVLINLIWFIFYLFDVRISTNRIVIIALKCSSEVFGVALYPLDHHDHLYI